MSLGVLVGVGDGLGAVCFRQLIITTTRLFAGYSDYSRAGHASNPHLRRGRLDRLLAAPIRLVPRRS